jgi:hypothetical protein
VFYPIPVFTVRVDWNLENIVFSGMNILPRVIDLDEKNKGSHTSVLSGNFVLKYLSAGRVLFLQVDWYLKNIVFLGMNILSRVIYIDAVK